MSTKLFILCGLVLTTIITVEGAPSSNLPKGFIQCKKSDPKFNECLKDGLQSAIPHLAEGVPSLGLIKVDPLRIIELKINQESGHPVNLDLKFNDVDLINLKHSQIKSVYYDSVNYNAKIEVLLPESLLLEGNYEVNGNVLVVPIKGKGKCKLVTDISNAVINVQFKPVVKNGNTFLDINNFTFEFTATKLHLKFDNLFNGDKALGDNMNVFLNENWRDILKELQPSVEQVLSMAFKEISQHFFNSIPENEIFLP
ncbi:Haemolymph juvenile hormone binding [Cinara cedri]|uniref:Haemolymph juvenile hormone binding n=1 Tax=Cinara cedri TaxID=506608 RepID=A0A5E4NDQ3_9HEMI|nr:Haemolymph juvenile hormone binding [Cinara cedri]